LTVRLLVAGGVCFALFVALSRVIVRERLSRSDLVLSANLHGANVPFASVLTVSGYGPTLTVLGLGSIAAAFALRLPAAVPLVILVSQALSQLLVNVSKSLFARARPDAWLYRHEPGFSYPSGHAVTAVVFYGAWAVVLWSSPLPAAVRIAGTTLLVAWALGIGLSRVALGAHYPSDVAGGFLFGLAWLCFALAAV
jgi:undecaprenyl-diphosphatase